MRRSAGKMPTLPETTHLNEKELIPFRPHLTHLSQQGYIQVWNDRDLGRLSDWFYVVGDNAVGAFTVRLLRTRMTAEQRRAHDSHYPFRFE